MRGAAQPAVLKKPGSHAGSADSSTTSCEVRLSASSAVVRVGRDCVTAGNKLGAVRQRSEVECRASLACQPFRGRRQCGRALSLQLRGRAVGPVQLACRMLVEGRLCKRFISSEAPSAAHVSPHCKGHRMSGAHGDGHDPRFACQGAGASKLWCRLQTAARSDLYHSTAPPCPPQWLRHTQGCFSCAPLRQRLVSLLTHLPAPAGAQAAAQSRVHAARPHHATIARWTTRPWGVHVPPAPAPDVRRRLPQPRLCAAHARRGRHARRSRRA